MSTSLYIGIAFVLIAGFFIGKQYGKAETLHGNPIWDQMGKDGLDCDRELENCKFTCQNSIYYQKYYDANKSCLSSCYQKDVYCHNPYLSK